MSDPILNKLAFNGYHVTFLNHEGREIEEHHYPTYECIMRAGYGPQEDFPTAEDFVEDMYRIMGDTVGMVKDNAGQVLYDNMQEMNDDANDPMWD